MASAAAPKRRPNSLRRNTLGIPRPGNARRREGGLSETRPLVVGGAGLG